MSDLITTKATLIELVANAIPSDNPIKSLLIEKLTETIPPDEEIGFLKDLRDPRVRRIINQYRRYAIVDGPINLAEMLDWYKRDSRNLIFDMERRLGEIEQSLARFGNVNPDKLVEVPGSVIIDIRFNTIAPPPLEE